MHTTANSELSSSSSQACRIELNFFIVCVEFMCVYDALVALVKLTDLHVV